MDSKERDRVASACKSIDDSRKMLAGGYRAFNGHIFSKADAERYNRIQERINAFRKAKMDDSDLLYLSRKTFFEVTGA